MSESGETDDSSTGHRHQRRDEIHPRIIFDTDMATDCDDAAALATLYALERRGEARVAATVVNNRGPRSAGAVAAMNAFYGRSDVPLGAYQGDDVGTTAAPFYADVAVDTATYGHERTERCDVPSAVSVYRRVLADADPNGVVVVSVGHLNNLSRLLRSDPDGRADVDGATLVARTVDHAVVMGGIYPSGTEHNFAARGSAPYTAHFLSQWPTPVVFSGYELGDAVRTGPELAPLDERHPVRRAYAGHPTNPLEHGRASWDQTAVLAAVRGPERYWDLSAPGRVGLESDGANSWHPDPDGPYRHLLARGDPSPDDVADVIGELMAAVP